MSKAKSVLGKDLMLFIDGKAIALATSCKLGLSAETIDTQSKDSGIWTEEQPVLSQSHQSSVQSLAEGAYTGSAVITSLEANAPDGDKATLSISFEGTGSLAKEAASK